MRQTDATFVTGLWNIGREDLGDFHRKFDHYLECFEKLLSLDLSLYVYVPEELLDFVNSRRLPDNTYIHTKSLADLRRGFPHFNDVQRIRNDPNWYNLNGWLKESTQAKLEYYNPIVMSKMMMLDEASKTNWFNSKHLFWIDADVCFWQYDIDKVIQSGLPFVSAPYSVKGWPALTTEFVNDEIVLGTNGGIYEVTFAATGFMYTHRSVYQKIIDHYKMEKVKIWGGQYEVYPFFLPLLVDGHYLGEDFAFCHRLRNAGIKLYCDTRIQLSHVGKYSYSFAFINNDGHPAEPSTVRYKQEITRRY